MGDLAWRRSWGHPSDETAAERAQVRGRYPLGRLPTWGNALSGLLGAEGVEGRTPWAGGCPFREFAFQRGADFPLGRSGGAWGGGFYVVEKGWGEFCAVPKAWRREPDLADSPVLEA